MLNRPFERKLPLSLKDTLLEGEIISVGKAICSFCNRVVPYRELKRGDFVYFVKECQAENIASETLIAKADESYTRYSRVREYLNRYAYYNLQIGESFSPSLEKIVNRDRVNTYVIRITDGCNSNCRICLDRNRIRSKEVTLTQLPQPGVLKNSYVALTGGEPTIREDLLKIISTLKKFGNHCSICTNGIKLSNPNYTRELGESGVDRVLLSFDGFGEGIYEVLRGRKDEYYYKLRALENLEKNNIPTALQLTVAWGVNFDQIGRVIDYAKEHSFINGVWIKPLFLPGVPFNSNFNTSHLVSVKEIKDYVCRYTGIADDYFQLFYKCKLKLYSILDKFFPGRKFSHPQEGQLFLRRKRGGLVPLIEREELENLCKGNLTGLNSYFRWLPFLLKSRLSPFTLEKNLLSDGVLAIIVASSKGPRDRDLSQPIHYLYLEPQNDRELGISSEISLITPEG